MVQRFSLFLRDDAQVFDYSTRRIIGNKLCAFHPKAEDFVEAATEVQAIKSRYKDGDLIPVPNRLIERQNIGLANMRSGAWQVDSRAIKGPHAVQTRLSARVVRTARSLATQLLWLEKTGF